jgi:Lar family restriction alleviation protein
MPDKFTPCPFCGSSNIALDQTSLWSGLPPLPDDHYAYCEDCGSHGTAASNVVTATRRWNDRKALNP